MGGLTPADHKLIALVMRRDGQLRAGLATLARLGVAIRRQDADRAESLVRTFETHPFYKAGQMLFDLMEWEDFLLDGDPLEPDTEALLAVVAPLAKQVGLPLPTLPDISELPSLEAGFHLFRDIAIGLLTLSSSALAGIPDLPDASTS